jgi:hypothetical protein
MDRISKQKSIQRSGFQSEQHSSWRKKAKQSSRRFVEHQIFAKVKKNLIKFNLSIVKVGVLRASHKIFNSEVRICWNDVEGQSRPGFFRKKFRIFRKILFFKFFEKWLRKIRKKIT